MAFEQVVADDAVRADLSAGLVREWERLAQPGTWWSGPERVAIARVARQEPTETIPGVAADAAALIGQQPWAIRPGWIESLVAEGLDYPRYVEIVGIVSRLMAVDAVHVALGRDLEPLPEPQLGAPSQESPRGPARIGKTWVPVVGGASITQALSLVPSESEAEADLHGALYLTYGEMGDPDIQRGLHRTQMELVAARTSMNNECFY